MKHISKIKEVWDGGFLNRLIISLVVLFVGSLITWGSWTTLSIAKTVTKEDCAATQQKNQKARDALEKRTSDKINRIEKEATQTRQDIKDILSAVGRIEGKLDR